jgi:hypothetical protein
MDHLHRRFEAFLKDESGLILAEALIMLPLLVWTLVAMFVYWDVFRTINMTQKAAYSIADLLSRQKTPISCSYADGLQKVLTFLTPNGHTTKMRITSFEYDLPTNKYTLLFSYSPESRITPVTQAALQTWAPKIPALSHMESVFVVETEVAFKSQMQSGLLGMLIGVDDQKFGEFIITRPRHTKLLKAAGC